MATVYLATTGSDAYTYAQAQNIATPWLTISKCETSASSGDTISIAAGTYTWVTQAFTKSFNIVGASPLTTFFDGGAAQISWYTDATGLTVAISNLTFRNAASTGNNQYAFCVRSTPTSTTTLGLTNCIVHTIVTYGDSTPNNGGVFSTWNTGGAALKVMYATNCLFYNITKVAAAGGGCVFENFVASATAANLTITGCVIYISGSGTSLITKITRGDWTFKNSIVQSVNSIPVGSTVGTYSDFYGVTSPPAGTGNITSDPLFVDAANVNFNLRPTSPCIDTGVVI